MEFAEGEYTKVIEVEIIDDDVWEETETFFVRLFNPSRGTEMDKICVTQVSIINDDGKCYILANNLSLQWFHTVNIVLWTADLSNIKHLCYLTNHRATYDVITTLLSEPGILQFQKPSYLYKESAGIAELIIERNDGCDGRITVQYKTKDITAVAGKDYDVSTIFSAAALCFSFDEIWCFVVLLFTLF